jgi:hypothetical protein
MGNLFCRSLPPDSPFDPLFDRMKDSGDPAYSAIASNFRCDHRVSKERQSDFDTPPLSAGADVGAFQSAVGNYYNLSYAHLRLAA